MSVRALADQRAFLAAAALVFVASAAATVAWCASMSAMPGMPMPGGWTMSMAWMRMPGQGWHGAAANFLGMWTLMMVAMMLPALVPTLLGYRRTTRAASRAALDRLTLCIAGGYFCAWLLLGAAIYLTGVFVAGAAMRSADVARLAPDAAGAVFIVVGALQAGSWKSRALSRCRRGDCRAKADAGSAWHHGLALGVRCVRCCAPWTAVLLALGVMDLAAMAFVTAVISMERLLRRGERIARLAGLAMIATGTLLLAH